MTKEYNNIQNSVISALSLYTFTKEYFESKSRMEGPILPLIMPILPIVLNKESARDLSNNQRRYSSFFNSLSDNRFIPVGLQERMVGMAEQTFKALNVAFSTKLLTYDKNNSQFIPISKTSVPRLNNKSNLEILKASKLLGFWFANLSIEDVLISLNITF